MKTKKDCSKSVTPMCSLLPLVVSFLLVGCSTPAVSRNNTAAAPDFNRADVIRVDTALKEAIRIYDEQIGLGYRKFRIDIRRIRSAWRVTFIYLPEAPDYTGVVLVHDDGKSESFLK